MARGANEFEALFPGLLDDMVAARVPKLDNRPDCIYSGATGHVLGTARTLRRDPARRAGRPGHAGRFPAGITSVRDGVAGCSPTYGRCMTMSSIQAGRLRRVLASGTTELAAELNRATAGRPTRC